MSKRKHRTLAAQLTPEQLEKVKREAAAKSLTMSAMMRVIIDQYFSADWLEFMARKLSK